MDVTQLSELAYKPIPKDYPEYKQLRPEKVFSSYKFHLVFCDGIVLRSKSFYSKRRQTRTNGDRWLAWIAHERAKYRQATERLRLIMAQLILAMKRVAMGGTIVILLHKLDSMTPASLVCAFSEFSKVKLFKPARKHATRSSFYMIAKNVDTKSPFFDSALQWFHRDYYESTFGGPDGLGKYMLVETDDVSPQTELVKTRCWLCWLIVFSGHCSFSNGVWQDDRWVSI